MTQRASIQHYILLTLLFLHCVFFKARSQDSLVTDVIILGTVHSPNPVYNSDSLMKAVLKLKPDVILIEQDSASIIFKGGQFKPLPGWSLYLRRITGWSRKDVEGTMLHNYHRAFPQVVFKPFDVAFNGAEREKYRKDYLQLEKDFAVAMYEAYEKKEMSAYRAGIHAERERLNASFWEFLDMGRVEDFNGDNVTNLSRHLETLDTIHFKALVDSVASLRPFAARIYEQIRLSERRNEVMVQQILRYARAYRGKRIIAISGLLHRYYQLDKLAPLRSTFNFRLLDLNGKVMTFPGPVVPDETKK
jgi:hypothetical protein